MSTPEQKKQKQLYGLMLRTGWIFYSNISLNIPTYTYLYKTVQVDVTTRLTLSQFLDHQTQLLNVPEKHKSLSKSLSCFHLKRSVADPTLLNFNCDTEKSPCVERSSFGQQTSC